MFRIRRHERPALTDNYFQSPDPAEGHWRILPPGRRAARIVHGGVGLLALAAKAPMARES
jgi:hypothetical protein